MRDQYKNIQKDLQLKNEEVNRLLDERKNVSGQDKLVRQTIISLEDKLRIKDNEVVLLQN